MYRAVHRRLLRVLKPYTIKATPKRKPCLWQATAVVVLPAAHTAAEPRWSPGLEYVEISTASKWGARSADGQLHAVVRSTDRCSDHQVLIRGALTAADLLGMGGITDKPHRLRWMALPGTLSEQRLADMHPAMLYDRWYDTLIESAGHRLALSGLPIECCDRVELTRRPDGRYQLVLELSVEAPYFADDVATISRALTRITRSYGDDAQLRLYRPDVSDTVTDPLYTDARRRLTIPTDFGEGTFLDRLNDLIDRASPKPRPTTTQPPTLTTG